MTTPHQRFPIVIIAVGMAGGVFKQLWNWELRSLAMLFALVVFPPVALLVWAFLYACAPRLTKYATVFGLLGLLGGSLLSCALLQAREEARRNSAVNNLRTMALELQNQNQFQQGQQPWQRRETYMSPAGLRDHDQN
jgi:hypothetical protein